MKLKWKVSEELCILQVSTLNKSRGKGGRAQARSASMCWLHSQMSSKPHATGVRYSCWATLGLLCMKRETVHFQVGVTLGRESDPLE